MNRSTIIQTDENAIYNNLMNCRLYSTSIQYSIVFESYLENMRNISANIKDGVMHFAIKKKQKKFKSTYLIPFRLRHSCLLFVKGIDKRKSVRMRYNTKVQEIGYDKNTNLFLRILLLPNQVI